jgi:hypothetical protein
MNNKLILTFAAVLVISSVNSSPSYRAISGHQFRVSQIQRSFLEVFSAYNEDDDNDEDVELDATYEIGPDINQGQFVAMLKRDINNAYQRKCKKISGVEDGYTKVKEAKKEAETCMKNWVNSEELTVALQNAKSNGDFKPFINKICVQRNVPFKCIDNYRPKVAACSYPSEIAISDSFERIFNKTVDLICLNDGDDFALSIQKFPQCFESSESEVKTCSMKAGYAILKRILEKLIENEHFEFKMDAEDCKEFDAVKSCFVSAVENCADSSVKKYIKSSFDFVRDESNCSKLTPIQTNLLA